MSYAFDMNFVKCSDIGEAFDIANKASEAVFNGLRKLLVENHCFIPSVRYALKDTPESRARNNLWLRDLMTLRFVWWPEYKLLGFVGQSWPEDALSRFSKSVFFQNSCDQDYGFDSWEGIGEPFDSIVQTAQTGPIGDVTVFANMGRTYPSEFDPEEDDEPYFRRSAAYNAIYETLKLDRWLWGGNDLSFTRFAITPLNTTERVFDAETLVREIANV